MDFEHLSLVPNNVELPNRCKYQLSAEKLLLSLLAHVELLRSGAV